MFHLFSSIVNWNLGWRLFEKFRKVITWCSFSRRQKNNYTYPKPLSSLPCSDYNHFCSLERKNKLAKADPKGKISLLLHLLKQRIFHQNRNVFVTLQNETISLIYILKIMFLLFAKINFKAIYQQFHLGVYWQNDWQHYMKT